MILVIDHYDSFTYNLVDLIHRCINLEVAVMRPDAITIADIRAMPLKALILSPGPGTPEQMGNSFDLIKALDGSLPILGICLGHQLIATAYGGQVAQANTIQHGAIDPIQLTASPLFEALGEELLATRYHSLAAKSDTLPPELRVIATSKSDGSIMAISHTSHPVVGFQFHPESYGTTQGEQLIHNFFNHYVFKERSPNDDTV